MHYSQTFLAQAIFCYDLATKTSWPLQRIGVMRGYAQFSEREKHFIVMVHEKADDDTYACYHIISPFT
jgi:hypothetical protein